MTEQNLIYQGLQLMTLGMAVVFIFLALLVLCTTVMSKAVEIITGSAVVSEPVKINTSVDQRQIIPAKHRAAIEQAIKQHRQRQS